jgi:cellulose synthase operon protein C
MVLHFPSQDVFRLALTSGTVSAAIQTQSARALLLKSGELWVDPSESLNARTLKSLGRLNVKAVESLPAEIPDATSIEACCWLQLIPLERVKEDASSFEKTTVLFRTQSSEAFSDLVAEMLRLGNDRQSFRHYQLGDDEFSLLRVIEPPYYSLLSALDRLHESGDSQASCKVKAFTEQAPRVWVQTGYRHPLASRIDPPAGQFVLLEPANHWQFVDEAVYQDVYSTLDLRLPSSSNTLTAIDTLARIKVPLRLVSGGTQAVAELWVLRERALEQLEALVTRSDDGLIGRLAFAVVESAEEPLVVLRTRPSRLAPPVLVLDGLSCAAYLKIPNLFLPVGKRLHPPLRRDAVAKLLAADNRKLTWLDADGQADFKLLSIADAAFRPLTDWIDYILEHEQVAMNAWIASHRFEFESFVCRDDEVKQPRQVPSNERPVKKPVVPSPASESRKSQDEPEASPTSDSTEPQVQNTPTKKTRKPTLNELQVRLEALEKQFLESHEALGSAPSQTAWQKMAVLHSHLKHRTDTTIAWCNGLWNVASPPTTLIQDWLQSEMRSSGRERIDISVVDQILSQKATTSSDTTLIAAYLIYSLATKKGVTDLKRRNAQLVQHFQKNERLLPIRTVWMTAVAMHQLVGSDTLGLARVRDRTLERLFQHGMQAELDVASFMRSGSNRQNDRFRVLATEFPDLLGKIDRWMEAPTTLANSQNKHYARLIGAYGLAKLGQLATCRAQVDEALNQLDRNDAIHQWMGQAYRFRIEQVAVGDVSGPLPPELLSQLETMERLDRYKVDKLRQQSRILEPHERIDPYRRWHRRYRDKLFQSLAELYDITDNEQTQLAVEKLLNTHTSGPQGLRVLATALEFAPRLGEQFGLRLLPKVHSLLNECEDDVEKSLLLQRAIYVAAHFGQVDFVQGLINVLDLAMPSLVEEYLTLQMQYNPDNKERVDTVEAVFLQSFRGLRKLGMRDQIGLLYGRVAEQVQAARPTGSKTATGRSGSVDPTEARSMRLLLCVAGGWYYFGQNEEANRIVDRVRKILTDGKLAAIEQRALAIAYVNAVSQAPAEEAMRRIVELFAVNAYGERVVPKIEDNLTTATHFSVSQMELIEASVLALMNDSLTLSPELQRWLDEDEFLVRKRIHEDMKRAMG